MKSYETVVITKPDVADSYVGTLTKKIDRIASGKPGEIIKKDDWGLKRLAYEIKGQRKGRYLFWSYKQVPGALGELDKQLRFDENIVRYMTFLAKDQETTKGKGKAPSGAKPPTKSETA